MIVTESLMAAVERKAKACNALPHHVLALAVDVDHHFPGMAEAEMIETIEGMIDIGGPPAFVLRCE